MGSESSDSLSSFVDDGVGFDERTPGPAHSWNINQWAPSASGGDAASSFFDTGSYVDDAADLRSVHIGAGPRIGKAVSDFYKDPGPKDRSKKYSLAEMRAVSGQIHNVLNAKAVTAHFNIEPVEETKAVSEKEKGKRGSKDQEEESEGVWIRVPRPVTKYIIEDPKTGHVIIVEGDNEPIDSRPLAEQGYGAASSSKKGKAAEARGGVVSSSKNKGKAPEVLAAVDKNHQQRKDNQKHKRQQDKQDQNQKDKNKKKSNYRAPTIESIPDAPGSDMGFGMFDF